MTESILTKSQRLKFGPKVYSEHGEIYRIVANVRHDDECGNGHNSFSITGDIYKRTSSGGWRDYSGGCIHDEIAKHFPELAPFIKWHLCSTDGPMHYVANTLYHARDRDCWGLRKGEVHRTETHVRFGANPIKHKLPAKFIAWLELQDFDGLSIESAHHKREPETFSPHYYFGGEVTEPWPDEWHSAPFKTVDDAQDFLTALQECSPDFVDVPVSWGDGSTPDLESARKAAIWPDATLEQLQDRGTLERRLPDLLAEFQSDVKSLGFVY